MKSEESFHSLNSVSIQRLVMKMPRKKKLNRKIIAQGQISYYEYDNDDTIRSPITHHITITPITTILFIINI